MEIIPLYEYISVLYQHGLDLILIIFQEWILFLKFIHLDHLFYDH